MKFTGKFTLLAATALLASTPKPNDKQIDDAMSGNACNRRSHRFWSVPTGTAGRMRDWAWTVWPMRRNGRSVARWRRSPAPGNGIRTPGWPSCRSIVRWRHTITCSACARPWRRAAMQPPCAAAIGHNRCLPYCRQRWRQPPSAPCTMCGRLRCGSGSTTRARGGSTTLIRTVACSPTSTASTICITWPADFMNVRRSRRGMNNAG